MGKYKSMVSLMLLLIVIETSAQQDDSISSASLTGGPADTLVDNFKRKIAALNINGLTVTDIRFIPQGSFAPMATAKELTNLPAFCLVAAVVKPSSDSYIRIEFWMPTENWNGRLLGTGNGGGGGNINYGSLAAGEKKDMQQPTQIWEHPVVAPTQLWGTLKYGKILDIGQHMK